ncbi:type I methionyl aminopeptidase [Mucilaginibacter sp. FT3.2]|uniref:type I methionyl aminopeptidase n=1 Tax=Mucilaginibacter sp. FT3.2 TaxID=2723090 RepID=UPI00161861D9|nr:type I methionyl aminopeptidase [Mucilaginibacter sp. FT3.2]MBB6233480.1 methionyl aminopeptidase [Mucilaginibacter sp. FT3.2]
MVIKTEEELQGIKKVSEAVALTLGKMKAYTAIGMSTKEIDEYGRQLLEALGARSAPFETYGFPGYSCISVNKEFAHGVPSDNVNLKNGDIINIDVSAELGGFWSDNGCSFVIGEDIQGVQHLIDTSKEILLDAISQISGGVRISDIGKLIETKAKKAGYTVIRDLGGHGVGRSLHEEPNGIMNYYDRYDKFRRFRKDSIVAIETFISTGSTFIETASDGWAFVGNKGGFVAQHEHTILITSNKPIILTAANGI